MKPTDADLCHRLAKPQRAAARAALAELYARHAPAVHGFLRRRRVDLADDLLQETFLVLARRAHQFEGASARPWLIAIARSLLFKAARSEAASRELHALAARHVSAATPELDSNADRELVHALAQLPAAQNEVLDLRFVQDLTHAQVAQVLGVSLRTAKTRAAQALAALRQLLADRLRHMPSNPAPPDPCALLDRFEAERPPRTAPALAITLCALPLVALALHFARPANPQTPVTQALQTWSAAAAQHLIATP